MELRPLRRGLSVLVLLSVGLTVSGCNGLTACSAVGYGYTGPAVVEFTGTLPDATIVSACFGDACVPAVLTPTDAATSEVPQRPPYLPADALGAGEERMLRVVLTGSAGVISDEIYDIPVAVERTGIFGQCPGPFAFEPVVIIVS